MSECEIPQYNAPAKPIEELLRKARTIAIVGLSDKIERDSYQVAEYLQQQGYRIIPVNPRCSEILGEKCYSSLTEVPVPVDIVDVFRRPDVIAGLAEETLALPTRPQGFWMQIGIVNNAAAARMVEAGLTVVQSKCIKVLHRQLAMVNPE